jgi:hypothetical protein
VDIDDSMKGAEIVEFPGGGLGGGEKASISPSASYSRMA